jgi:Peptidase family M1 domain
LKRTLLLCCAIVSVLLIFSLIFKGESFFSISSKEPFNAKEVPSGSKSTYRLSLEMDEDETFYVEAEIDITNVSEENWNEIVLYFIPNMFTKENAPTLENPALVNIHSLFIDGKASDYSLDKDTLSIPLSTQLPPGENIKLRMVYDFTLPSEGLRFTKEGENFHLAQWYPMVPTYRNGWNKQDFQSRGETYHTPFSDFHLEVEAPASYAIVSSSEGDDLLSKGSEVIIENEKDIFIALLKNASSLEKRTAINNVNIRVFGSEEKPEQKKEVLYTAVKALDFFNREFGGYTKKQFDVIIGGLGMEYPNVVTVGSIYNSDPVDIDSLKRMVVHEVAHQWFYGMVSNDPYSDAWLDEGFAEIATLLYYTEFEEGDFSFDFGNQMSKKLPLPVNFPLDQYTSIEMSSYIYSKSSTRLGILFKKYGGEDTAKEFIKEYVKAYQYKEVDSEEFVRFTKHHFNLESNKEFEEWLDLSE